MILKKWMMQIGDRSFSCTPPCTLFSVLNANRLVDDPYLADNEKQLQPYFEANPVFSSSFLVEKESGEKRFAFLEFDCLDTLCEVYLNGEFVGKANNFHRKWRFDIRNRLRVGENIVELRFSSAVNYARKRMRELYVWGNSEENGTLPGISYIRKPYYTFGWDWCPPMPDSGIVGEARLDVRDCERLGECTITQQFSGERVTINIAYASVAGGKIVTSLYTPEGKEIFSGEGEFLSVSVFRPRLWWPNGYGEQPLYTLQTELYFGNRKSEEQVRRIGLRKIELESKEDEYGKSFVFLCNGKKFFAKGANIIPLDCKLWLDVSKRMQELISGCAEANYNMLRVWGGGYYGDDRFYDLCDQYGILVWQDAMIACAHIRLDEEMEQNILAEFEENIRRISWHASLALVCGNNEMEPCAADLAKKKNFPDAEKIVADYLRLYEQLFPEVMQRVAPDTAYWPSSPSAGGNFYKSEDPDRGDSHFWKVWGELQPIGAYRTEYFRFLSEFGFVSFPCLETLWKFAGPKDCNLYSPIMECHQKNPAGNAKCAWYLREEFELPENFEMQVFATQYMQAKALETAVTHLRSRYGRCMGTLFWQLNDAYPAISFSVVDYYGRKKPAFYAVRRAYRNILLTGLYERGRVALTLINETDREREFQVKLWIADGNLRRVYEEEFSLTQLPFSAREVWSRDVSNTIAGRERELFFGYRLFSESGEEVRGALLFVPVKLFRWAEGRIEAHYADGGKKLALSANVFRKFVNVKDGDAEFSDNCVDIIDEEAVLLDVRRGGGKRLQLCSLYDIQKNRGKEKSE